MERGQPLGKHKQCAGIARWAARACGSTGGESEGVLLVSVMGQERDACAVFAGKRRRGTPLRIEYEWIIGSDDQPCLKLNGSCELVVGSGFRHKLCRSLAIRDNFLARTVGRAYSSGRFSGV